MNKKLKEGIREVKDMVAKSIVPDRYNRDAVIEILDKLEALEDMDTEPIKIAKDYFQEKGMKKLTCCICGCDFYDWTGHNPDPVVPDGEDLPCCCQSCNERFVIPARMKH